MRKLGQEAREKIGDIVGRLLAPYVGSISRARHARMFHPDGRVFVGQVEAVQSASPLVGIGEVLAGPAIARFSGALWRRGSERRDVLGVAIRFRHERSADAHALPGDQDLLFATIRSPFTMAVSPFTTDVRDFMANRYWAVSPFDAPGVGRVKFRLSPHGEAPSCAPTREDRLESRVARDSASWNLEARHTFRLAWTTIARLTLEDLAEIDQATLRFDPFHCGRGIVPRGLVHAIRRAVYPASQAARPSSEGS